MVDPAVTDFLDRIEWIEDALAATEHAFDAYREDQDRALKLALVRIERLEKQIGALDVDADRRLRALESGR